MSLRAYVNLSCNATAASIEEWQLHYRSQGAGADVVLLHPSPLSCEFMQPIMDLLSDDCRVYALDTPGYGQSDPLPQSCKGLSGYVEALHQFIVALELKTPLIYGSATGAQIAIEYAKAYPEHTCGLVLENAAWFTDEERDIMLSKYFPSISAQDDGGHLSLVWNMVSQLYEFFPWFDTSASARVNSAEIPAAFKHKTLMGYFTAGENYDLAYRAAFMNEKPEQLRQVTVPTHILNWESGLLKKYVDRLYEAALPKNITIKPVSKGLEFRFRELKSSVLTLLSDTYKKNS
ncbi:alpha/beta hydrolase [Glaciecola punicea]|uniref:alpha/beta fold hydrolase n=1 Tax=Glaciecola punicea TaxID=56804 RepID=UPI0008723065|nr:alpha/beta hydrolase [Glaciecola punicea]OFA29861.1 alpha/beta hydrolase [Glaciecola punicea]